MVFNAFNSSSPLVSDFERTQYKDLKGRIFLTVGTGGGDFHVPKYQNEYFVNTYVGRGCLVIEVDEEAIELKAQFFSLDDKTIDSFTIEKSINQNIGDSMHQQQQQVFN